MDMNKIDELVEKRLAGDFEDPIGFEQYIALFVELLGDDEAEVLNFINNATVKQGMALYEAYEEIIDKFRDEGIRKAVQRYL